MWQSASKTVMVISAENVNKYQCLSLTADKNVDNESSESSYCHMKGQKSIKASTHHTSLVPPAIFQGKHSSKDNFYGGVLS